MENLVTLSNPTSSPAEVASASNALQSLQKTDPSSLALQLIHSLLQTPSLLQSCSPDVITLTWTLLKNCVVEKWRSKGRRRVRSSAGAGGSSVSTEEIVLSDDVKMKVCEFLVGVVCGAGVESMQPTGKIVAVMYSKIIRSEVLSPSPSNVVEPMLSPLISSVSLTGGGDVVNNDKHEKVRNIALLVLSKVLKELSTIRLQSQRKTLMEISTRLYIPIVSLLSTSAATDDVRLCMKCLYVILPVNQPTFAKHQHLASATDSLFNFIINHILPRAKDSGGGDLDYRVHKWVGRLITETYNRDVEEFEVR